MSDRWKRQRELFDAASRLPQEKRHAFLEQACADDSALIGTIEALLAEHDEDDDSISPTIRESAKALLETPEQIGRYSIRGGVGQCRLP